MAGDAVADPLQACRGVRRRRAPLVTPGEACDRACIASGDTFTVSAAERDEYAARGWAWRRRCEPCLIGGHGAKANRA